MRQMFLNALAIFASACVMLFAPIRHASAYTEAVLHSSCHAAGCIDGRIPHGLLRDSSGNLFGTTHYGGKYKKGVVFKLVPNADGTKYTDHIIHNFCAKANCARVTGSAAPRRRSAATARAPKSRPCSRKNRS